MSFARLPLLLISALLLACVLSILIRAGSEKYEVLLSTRARLDGLRSQRLDPQDIDEMSRALAAPPDARAGLLIASDEEATLRLEELIRSKAQEFKAEVQSISLMSDPVSSKLPAVHGKLHLIVSDDNIGSFVQSLESGTPAVFFETLRIASMISVDIDNDVLLLDLSASILVYRDTPTVRGTAP